MRAREKEWRAFELRKSGLNWRQVAEQMGIRHRRDAYRLVHRMLARTDFEHAEEYRRLDGERLDDLLRGIWSAACAGNLNAIDRVLKIIERRARLFGYEQLAPVTVNLNETVFDERRTLVQYLLASPSGRAQAEALLDQLYRERSVALAGPPGDGPLPGDVAPGTAPALPLNPPGRDGDTG